MASLKQAVGRLVLAAGVVTLVGGCKFFDLSNPLIPKARLFAQPSGSTMTTVSYTYKTTDGTITFDAKETQVEISSYPGDGTPGTYINAYSAEYLDEAAKPIPTITLSKLNFGVSSYVPPATAGNQSKVKMQLPVYNQQVLLYGQDQVFSFSGGVSLNHNLIHTINCSVTLYGEDDNFNEITIPLNIPIRFDGKITT